MPDPLAKRRKGIRCWTFGVLLVSVCLALAGGVAKAEAQHRPHAKALRLLAEFNKRKAYPLDDAAWRPENGPWAPYIAEPPTDGLSARERELYRAALRLGDCQTVIGLQITSLLLRHPEIRSAHAYPSVSEAFVETVVKKSPDYAYCVARGQLLSVRREVQELRLGSLMPFRADLAVRAIPFEADAATREGRLRSTLCRAIRTLVGLALRQDHREAIQDLLEPLAQERLAVLPAEIAYYLNLRARRLKLTLRTGEPSGDALALLRNKIAPRTRQQIERFSKMRKGRLPDFKLWRCPLLSLQAPNVTNVPR